MLTQTREILRDAYEMFGANAESVRRDMTTGENLAMSEARLKAEEAGLVMQGVVGIVRFALDPDFRRQMRGPRN